MDNIHFKKSIICAQSMPSAEYLISRILCAEKRIEKSFYIFASEHHKADSHIMNL